MSGSSDTVTMTPGLQKIMSSIRRPAAPSVAIAPSAARASGALPPAQAGAVGMAPVLPSYSAAPAWAQQLNQAPMAPLFQYQPWSGPMFNNMNLGLNAYNASAVPDYRALLGQMLRR